MNTKELITGIVIGVIGCIISFYAVVNLMGYNYLLIK